MKLIRNSLGLWNYSLVNLDTLNQIDEADIWVGSIDTRTKSGIGLCPKEIFDDYLKLDFYYELSNSSKFSSTLIYYGSPLYLLILERLK